VSERNSHVSGHDETRKYLYYLITYNSLKDTESVGSSPLSQAERNSGLETSDRHSKTPTQNKAGEISPLLAELNKQVDEINMQIEANSGLNPSINRPAEAKPSM
jgi:hypothetical protein